MEYGQRIAGFEYMRRNIRLSPTVVLGPSVPRDRLSNGVAGFVVMSVSAVSDGPQDPLKPFYAASDTSSLFSLLLSCFAGRGKPHRKAFLSPIGSGYD